MSSTSINHNITVQRYIMLCNLYRKRTVFQQNVHKIEYTSTYKLQYRQKNTYSAGKYEFLICGVLVQYSITVIFLLEKTLCLYFIIGQQDRLQDAEVTYRRLLLTLQYVTIKTYCTMSLYDCLSLVIKMNNTRRKRKPIHNCMLL